MKTVFSSNSEAIHIWANHPDRSGRANSVSFGGGVLWSYNTAIAQHVTNERGEKAVILNKTSYSNTTSKHQGETAYATNHLKRIYVSHIGYNTQNLKSNAQLHGDRDRLIESYEYQAAQYLAKAERARTKKADYEAAAYQHLNELKEYLAFFDIEYETPANMDELKQAAIERENEAKRIATEMKTQREAAERERLEKWRNGDNVYSYFEVTALRVHGENIETTKGAKIPIDHAVKVWPLLKRLHDSGGKYERGEKSIRLGHYTLDSFDGDILRVGCHIIPFAEVQNIANQLGL